jgi:hypothetical protein
VIVFSTFGITAKALTNLLNSSRSLNFATIIVSVEPVISYTPHTFTKD